MAYCDSGDLKYGKMPIANVIDVNRYIGDAADEIDICMGVRWKTPIILDTNGHPEQRPLKLMLKAINANLASGRIILAATLATEDNNIHAYGYSLIQSAKSMLEALESGKYDYPGLDPIGGDPSALGVGGPTVLQQDSASGVDRFFEAVAPGGVFPERRIWDYGVAGRVPWL